jgi:hypothetical protein
MFDLLAVRDDPQTAKAELLEMLRIVSGIPAFDDFNIAHQHAFGWSESVNLLFLVSWLIDRAQQCGAAQAISDLERYLSAEKMVFAETLAFSGLRLDSPVDLGEVQLVPWSSVVESETKWKIQVRSVYAHRQPDAALVRPCEAARLHVRPWESVAEGPPISIEPLRDILRAVTVVAGAGIAMISHWFEPPPWAPWNVYESGFGASRSRSPFAVTIEPNFASAVGQIAAKLNASDDAFLDRIRLPIDRLNRSYLHGTNFVDASIDLGISIESLFAPTKMAEGIGFAVRTRCARFLGSTPEERNGIVSKVKDVYDLRSRGVHSGRFDAKGSAKKWHDNEKVREAIQAGQSLIGSAIEKIVIQGEPDWEKFDIDA